MIVRVKGENVDLSTLNCQFVDLKGSALLNLSLIKRDNNMFSAKLVPPHLPFKVRCYGRDFFTCDYVILELSCKHFL